jgi:hypothetical protein
MKKFDVKKVKDVDASGQKNRNRFDALESPDDTMDINTTWGSVLV